MKLPKFFPRLDENAVLRFLQRAGGGGNVALVRRRLILGGTKRRKN
ncbi:MAG: hypothetical protein ACR2P5_07555 [Gammaproteobacteria bacterium]